MRMLVVLVVLLAGCATPNRYEQEFQAYIGMVNEEIRAGRITLAQGEYLVAQKRNQLESQRDAERERAMAVGAMGASMMNTGPIFIPRGPRY